MEEVKDLFVTVENVKDVFLTEMEVRCGVTRGCVSSGSGR